MARKIATLPHLTDETTAPAPRKARGAAYFCARCEKEHPPILYPDVPGSHALEGRELRAQWKAAADYKSHKDWADGTDAAHALRQLRKWIEPGDSINTTTDRPSVARKVRLFIVQDGRVANITGLAATAGLGSWDDKHGALSYGGWGYSAAFQAVYDLGHLLFADAGFKCTGHDSGPHRCPSNDHSNGDRDYTAGKMHSDAGYSLHQVGL